MLLRKLLNLESLAPATLLLLPETLLEARYDANSSHLRSLAQASLYGEGWEAVWRPRGVLHLDIAIEHPWSVSQVRGRAG